MLDYDKPIVLVADALVSERLNKSLRMIGLTPAAHSSLMELKAHLQNGARTESIETVSAKTLAADSSGQRILDVRGTGEWNSGHIEGATHIYLGELAERADSLSRDEPIVVHCESGTRSSIAASMLLARGFTKVKTMPEGIVGWERAGLPLQRDK